MSLHLIRVQAGNKPQTREATVSSLDGKDPHDLQLLFFFLLQFLQFDLTKSCNYNESFPLIFRS